MFSAASVCLFVNTITSERVNIGWWNLGARCIVQKSRPSFHLEVIAPWVCTHKYMALGYDVGQISAGCLDFKSVFIYLFNSLHCAVVRVRRRWRTVQSVKWSMNLMSKLWRKPMKSQPLVSRHCLQAFLGDSMFWYYNYFWLTLLDSHYSQ